MLNVELPMIQAALTHHHYCPPVSVTSAIGAQFRDSPITSLLQAGINVI